MKNMSLMKTTGVGGVQKALVSEYFVMNSCIPVRLGLFSMMSSKVRSILVVMPPTDAPRLACDRISYPDSR